MLSSELCISAMRKESMESGGFALRIIPQKFLLLLAFTHIHTLSDESLNEAKIRDHSYGERLTCVYCRYPLPSPTKKIPSYSS